MKKSNLFIIIIVIIIAFLALIYYSSDKKENNQRLPENKDQNQEEGPITVTNPSPKEIIKSPLNVYGEAKGAWYFEATFPIILTDWDGKIIAETYAQAQEEWMTEKFVPFEAKLEFENPYTADSPDFMKNGSLIFKKANPSGLPENDDALEIPIQFSAFEEKTEEEIAESWIKENSPTYTYDGMELELIEVRGLDLVGCENCYEVEFTFKSRQAGYGDRTGKSLAQVITLHTVVVTIKDGQVIKVITDQTYDEINQKILSENN